MMHVSDEVVSYPLVAEPGMTLQLFFEGSHGQLDLLTQSPSAEFITDLLGLLQQSSSFGFLTLPGL
jgi:hypothetical protein